MIIFAGYVIVWFVILGHLQPLDRVLLSIISLALCVFFFQFLMNYFIESFHSSWGPLLISLNLKRTRKVIFQNTGYDSEEHKLNIIRPDIANNLDCVTLQCVALLFTVLCDYIFNVVCRWTYNIKLNRNLCKFHYKFLHGYIRGN